jgi:hypothetical protein
MSAMDNAYALIVGIASHAAVRPLPQTILNDARDVFDVLVDPQRGGYLLQNMKLLLDEQATRAAIETALDELADHANRDATVSSISLVMAHGCNKSR